MVETLKQNWIAAAAICLSLLSIGISVHRHNQAWKKAYAAAWNCPVGWEAKADGCYDDRGNHFIPGRPARYQ